VPDFTSIQAKFQNHSFHQLALHLSRATVVFSISHYLDLTSTKPEQDPGQNERDMDKTPASGPPTTRNLLIRDDFLLTDLQTVTDSH